MALDFPLAPARLPARLGSAHLSLAVLIVPALLYSALPWPAWSTGDNLRPLAATTGWTFGAGVAYLVASGWLHLHTGNLLRGGRLMSKGAASLAFLAHALVGTCVLNVLSVGAASRTLLVSLDRLAAALACVSALSLLLTAGDWLAAHRWEKRNADDESETDLVQSTLAWPLVLLAAALLLAAGIFSLERRDVSGRHGMAALLEATELNRS